MKMCIVAMFACLQSIIAFGQEDAKLPLTWSKDLTIEFTFSGSMDGSNTQGRITYDSCILIYQAGHKAAVKGIYKMKESDRSTIIKRLRELRADEIKSEARLAPVNDGWSQTVRIGGIWLSGGTSVEMREDDRLRFGEVYNYLEAFALKKSNPK